MDAELVFIADLTVALTAAMLAGALASRLRLNPILGYLVAGIAIGPFTPGYVAHHETIASLAELGLIFLLFSIGLGFSFDDVRKLGAVPLAGNVVVLFVVAAVAGLAAHLLQLPHPVTIAIVAAVSSTAVGEALLHAASADGAPAGKFAIAQLVVQDLVAVALLVLVTTPAGELTPSGILLPIGRAVIFVAIALVLGATLLQRLVRGLLATASSDVQVGAFSAFALVAAWLGYFAGLSFDFGAFIAGAVISEAAGSKLVASVVAPFRAVFVALFFVSVGMLLDPRAIAAHWLTVVIAGLAFALIRFAAWSALARLARIAAGGIALAAVALTALGEFNVVLLQHALAAGRLNDTETQLLLGVVFVSIVAAVVAGPLLNGRAVDAVRPQPGA